MDVHVSVRLFGAHISFTPVVGQLTPFDSASYFFYRYSYALERNELDRFKTPPLLGFINFGEVVILEHFKAIVLFKSIGLCVTSVGNLET